MLDEPTSGLDAYAASRLTRNLRDIVQKRQLACLMTIHQPSWAIFCALDRVILLAKGGVYYDGPPKATIEYFKGIGYEVPEGVNPADHFVSIAENEDRDDAGTARVKALVEAWTKRKSESSSTVSMSEAPAGAKKGKSAKRQEKAGYPTSWVSELLLLLSRAFWDEVSLM